MQETSKKRPVLKFLSGLFGNVFVRGTLKSLPGAGLVYEIVDTVKWFRKYRGHLAENKTGEVPEPPHSAVSMLLQAGFLVVILWAFFTKQINADDLLRWISPDDFKEVGSVVVDSLNHVNLITRGSE